MQNNMLLLLFFSSRYFVLNFVDFDLSKVIKRGKPFTEDHIKLIIYSLLRGLKFIHSAGVIHRVKLQSIDSLGFICFFVF